MRSTLKITIATFGIIAGLAGLEHGIGEILQGNRAPDGIVIASWPDSAFFQILSGEPAMTIIPNLLLSGIVTVIISLLFMMWAILFVQQVHGGLILLLLSLFLLLVGGGFRPPLLGAILSLAAAGMNAQFTWLRAHLAPNAERFVSSMWPWLFAAAFVAWLLVLPGSILLDAFVGINDATLYTCIFSAFGLLLVTIIAAFVRDLQQRPQLRPALNYSKRKQGNLAN